MALLINKERVKTYALQAAVGMGKVLYGGQPKFTRVSSRFYEDVDRVLREEIERRVRSTTAGRTL